MITSPVIGYDTPKYTVLHKKKLKGYKVTILHLKQFIFIYIWEAIKCGDTPRKMITEKNFTETKTFILSNIFATDKHACKS